MAALGLLPTHRAVSEDEFSDRPGSPTGDVVMVAASGDLIDARLREANEKGVDLKDAWANVHRDTEPHGRILRAVSPQGLLALRLQGDSSDDPSGSVELEYPHPVGHQGQDQDALGGERADVRRTTSNRDTEVTMRTGAAHLEYRLDLRTTVLLLHEGTVLVAHNLELLVTALLHLGGQSGRGSRCFGGLLCCVSTAPGVGFAANRDERSDGGQYQRPDPCECGGVVEPVVGHVNGDGGPRHPVQR